MSNTKCTLVKSDSAQLSASLQPLNSFKQLKPFKVAGLGFCLLSAFSALMGLDQPAQAQLSAQAIARVEKGGDILVGEMPSLLRANSKRALSIAQQLRANPKQTKQILTSNRVEWCGTMAQTKRIGFIGATNHCTNGPADLPANRNAQIPTASTPFKTVRVKINIFANDDGSSPAASLADADKQVAQLNADFAPARIRFINNGARIINSTRFRRPVNGGSEIDAMKTAHNVDPARNLNMYVFEADGFDATLLGAGYFPSDPNATGAPGGFFCDNDAFGAGERTATHEIGHNFGVFHPHYGVSDMENNYGDHCSVACAEYAGRSAADGDTTGDLCSDTPPTPRNFACGPPQDDPGTPENEAIDPCNSIPWGTTDYTNFMGYADDDCINHFTPQQMGLMHGWINNVLSGWLVGTNTADPPVVTLPGNTDTATITGTGFAVSFSKPMNPATTQAAFRFAPALTGTYAWSNGNQTVTFTPAALASGTAYQVKILGTAPSSANAALTLDGNFSETSQGSPTDDYVFTFRTTGGPANNNFASAQVITGNGDSIPGFNIGATKETNEPNHGQGTGGASVWYKWVPASTGNVTFDTRTTPFDTSLAVYTGGSVGTLTKVESNDDEDYYGGIYTSRLTFRAIANTSYYIAVDGYKKDTATPTETGNFRLTWNNIVSPPNDFWANAQLLTGAAGTATGTTLGAYDETSEPYYSNNESGVWYKWVAPTNGAAYFDTEGSDFDTNLLVCTGTGISQLTKQEYDADSGTGTLSHMPFTTVGGTTYYIAVSGGNGFDGARGAIKLNWRTVVAPANDPFASAQLITGTQGGLTASNIGASTQTSEQYGAYTQTASVWYKWTAPGSGIVTMDTFGSGNNEAGTLFNTSLSIWTGSALGSLTRMAANNDALGQVTSQVKWTAVGGTTYYISVDAGAGSSWRDAHGRFALNWKFIGAPANDLFANAQLITGQSGKIGGTNLGANTETSEQYGAYTQTASVWFKWTAPTNGMAVFDTFGSGNNQSGTPFNTSLSIWTGGGIGSLTRMAANNDALGQVTSQVKWTAVGGTTYYISVDTGASNYDETMGDYALNWKLTPAPANDLFANRTVITGNSGRATGTTIGANTEAGEQYGAYTQTASVWFRWTAPSGGTVVFDTAGSGNNMAGTLFNTSLSVWEGSAIGSLTRMAANNDAPGLTTSSVSLTAVAGTTYHISVDTGASNYDETMGNYRLNWSLNGVPINTPTVTSFSPQKGVAGTTVIITGTSFIVGASTVKFGGVTATATVNSTTQITATVPANAVTGQISVTTANGTGTSADTFTVGPSITSFTPLQGAVGAPVVITGKNFIGVTTVKFNTTSATAFTVNSSTQITATVPAGATTGKITTTNDAGSAVSTSNFIPGPWIGSLAPIGGAVGSAVAINGGNFVNVTGVKFNNGTLAATAFTVNSATKITATVPVGAVTGPISVTAGLGTAFSATDFLIYPGITSFSPSIGKTNTSVTILGSNFTGAMFVKFGGVNATTFTLNSVNKITAKVPEEARSGKITVVTPAGSVDSVERFTIDLTAPRVFIDAPLVGGARLAALPATITGTVSDNIAITNVTAVRLWLRRTFNGAFQYWNPLANPPAWGPTLVRFDTDAARPNADAAWSYSGPLPAGTDLPDGTYALAAIAIDGAGNSASRVINLYLKSTTPTYSISGQITLAGTTTGVAGVQVTRTGSATSATTNTSGNFTLTGVAGGTYTITPALTGYTFAPTSKPATVGTANVSGINFSATSLAPTITSFTPTSGAAGTIVTVTGTKFTGATGVKFNGVTATFNTVTATSLKATAPAGVTTGKITLTTPNGTATSAANFTVAGSPPTISTFTPTSGAAGTVVTISGTNFTGATSVRFNGTTATFNTVTATSLNATAPAGVTTGTLSVTTPNGTATSAASFTVTAGTDTTPPTVTVTAPTVNGTYAALATASGTASDAGTGVNSVYVALAQYDAAGTTLTGWWDWVNQIWIADGNDPNTTTLATGTTSWSKPLPAVGAGNYEVWVTALDNSTTGNQAPWVTVKYTNTNVPNNNFANAQVITGNNSSVVGSNIGATKETGEPDHDGNEGGASVWYRWTAPSNGTLAITTIGSNFDTILAVYTGTSVSALTGVLNGSNDDGTSPPASNVTISVTAGTIYRIAVDGYNLTAPDQGSIQLNWTFTAGGALKAGATNSAASSSPVQVSTADANSEAATVTLTFDGALGAAAGDAAHYAVSVNGVLVAVQEAAYDAAANRVVLSLPAGTLHTGDKVSVAWTNVPDAQSRLISGSTTLQTER